MGSDLALIDNQAYLDTLPAKAKQLCASRFCPETWRFDPIPFGANDNTKAMIKAKNEAKHAEVVIVGMSLAEVDMRLNVQTLPQCYVVKGAPRFMAQLLCTIASRHGVKIVPLDDESSDKVGVVKILAKDNEWHRVTVTIEEAKKAGWDKKNPNYTSMPKKMLMARATTAAIDQNYPEVRFLLPPGVLDVDVVDVEELLAVDEEPTAEGASNSTEDASLVPAEDIVDAELVEDEPVVDEETGEIEDLERPFE